MEEGVNFNRLVSELSLNERVKMLSQLSSQSEMTQEPLYKDEHDGGLPSADLKKQYSGLPWYYKVYYYIIGLFKSQRPDVAYENSRAAKLGALINVKYPGFFDQRREVLLSEFYDEVTALKENARFFFNALDASVSRDRGAFYAFLASLEMEDIHRRLVEETDPEKIMKNNNGISNEDMHQIALRAMESIFSSITEDQRNKMYFDVRCLQCLKELSSFLFDRVLMAFAQDSSHGKSCAVRLIREQLMELNNILFSMSQVPAISLLESIFVFMLQEQDVKHMLNVESEARALLSRAEFALEGIRYFNKTIPLTLILRYAYRDMELIPQHISGGEDWFVIYRDYWKKLIDDQYHSFNKAMKEKLLAESFNTFLDGNPIKPLIYAAADFNSPGVPVAGAMGLAFLAAFYTHVFIGDVNNVLRPILLSGEFFKRENRTKFTEAYNDLVKAGEFVQKFDDKLSGAGEYGKRYAQAKDDISSLPVKRRKIQSVIQEASDEAMRTIDSSREALKTMIQILNGILRRDTTGSFDTLSNLASFSAKNAPPFTRSVEEAVVKLERALKLLDEANYFDAGK